MKDHIKGFLLSSSALARCVRTLAVLLPLSFSSFAAFAFDDYALPQGEQVVGGSANFERTSRQLTVDQQSDRLFVDWDSFNIGKKARTDFVQPASKSLAVNRVVGSSVQPTRILGRLTANGRVVVLDQNGVIFSPGSVVDVNGIVVSTGDLDPDAVMDGDKILTFDNFGSGKIVNQGTFVIEDSGLAAFVSPHVENSGTIFARLGRIEFAAGEAVTVDLYGDKLVEIAVDDELETALLKNTGRIQAEAGAIAMTARAAKGIVDNVINMNGLVQASSVQKDGGRIILSAAGNNADIAVGGRLIANGKKGGEIEISGQNVKTVYGSRMMANANGNGNDGGMVSVEAADTALIDSVITVSGKKGGSVTLDAGSLLSVDGVILARGDRTTGEGGEVNLTSDRSMALQATIDVFGKKGGDVNIQTDVFTKARGRIMAKGDYNIGEGGNVNVHSNANVAFDARVDASGSKGGNITIESEDFMIVSGQFYAMGKTTKGNGGNVVISSDGNATVNALIDVSGKLGGDIDISAANYLNGRGYYYSRSYQVGGKGGDIKLDSGGGLLFKGALDVYGHDGGDIELTAAKYINVSGKMFAKGDIQDGKGGNVEIFSDHNGVTLNNFIDTTASKDGSIKVTGKNVLSTSASLLYANRTNTDNGGKIVIEAENSIHLSGHMKTRGGNFRSKKGKDKIELDAGNTITFARGRAIGTTLDVEADRLQQGYYHTIGVYELEGSIEDEAFVRSYSNDITKVDLD